MDDSKKGNKYGARVYFYPDGVVQVCQTILKNGRYVIDGLPGNKLREKWVDPGDDAKLGAAVRLAGEGKL